MTDALGGLQQRKFYLQLFVNSNDGALVPFAVSAASEKLQLLEEMANIWEVDRLKRFER